MEIKQIEGAIEGLLFAAGDAVSLDKIAEIIEVDKKTTRSILNTMIVGYEKEDRGIMMREIDNAYQLCTKADYFEYVKKFFEPRQKQGLSQAAFEVLSIIVYNQPVTRQKIEHIRGVSSDSAVIRLLEKNLIFESGRLDAPGKPILYEVTEEFLRNFGYKSVNEIRALELNAIEIMEE